jgi:NAD(P)H-dependent FMN reductase
MQPLEGVEDSLALLGVAGGRIGAIKALEQLRAVCAHTGAMVVPGSVSVAGVRAAFNEEGLCLDEDVEASLRGLATGLLDFVKDFVCPKYALEGHGARRGHALGHQRVVCLEA